MVDEGKKGISLGAVEHLRKPVNRDQLKQIVGKYVRAAGSVLIVEDDVATQDVTASALKALGIDAMIASNGQEALDILQKEKPDLVLLDLMMPVMDGFEFLEHFRKLENSEAIPVIVVTAKDLTREERQNLSKRVTHIVEKEEDYVKELLRNVGFAVKASETGE